MKEQQYLLVTVLPILLAGCVEPFEPEGIGFDSMLVVEANITNEEKVQEILISRTFALDTTGIYGEGGAIVQITDSEGATYPFVESSEGKYRSQNLFTVKTGLGYTLSIETRDGSRYISSEERAQQPIPIDSIFAERDFKDGDANEGIFIYVNSFDLTGQSGYYRYEYEETYKIIAPYWAENDFFLVDGTMQILPRTVQNLVCYNTVGSIDILQTSTEALGEAKVTKFPVRFIDRGDFKITYRYSLLVRQFVQTRSAFHYFETLNKLNGSESVFSQYQNGFIESNISSVQNKKEKTVGYFQVSSVTERRLFFNYEDFFPGESRPRYAIQCPILNYEPSLIYGVYDLAWIDDYDPVANPLNFWPIPNPWIAVPRPCSDCTALGSNMVPDFWVED